MLMNFGLKVIPVLLYIVCSASLFAKNIDIHDKVWLVSNMVTGNVHWAENFLEIEKLAKEKNGLMLPNWQRVYVLIQIVKSIIF